jgi:diguanylate cyclase (GGDEF)-like protein
MAVWDEEGNAVRIAGSISDITDRKNAEEQLMHDAFHDSLTNLANKALFFDRLSQALLRVQRYPDYRFAVLFMDLDRFKDINDSIGHLVGDHMLIEVAKMLKKGVRSVDTLARFGGDEFIILLDDIKDDQGVMRVADWIRSQLTKPIKVDDHEIYTSTSIGIVYSNPEYNTHEEVIRDADIAMYFAKNQGGDRAEVFEQPMRQRVLERLSLESDLRRAIGGNELRVHYQAIGDLNSGKLIGFEALIRWEHPEMGLLSPGKFMGLAEETGMVIDIDRWVLREACQQIHTWNQKFDLKPSLSVSVNISAKHIASPELRQYVIQVLEETGLESKKLKLEITEFSLVDHSEITAAAFSNLHDLGIQIQIDDFGTGYSSLGYLSSFPISALKIDRSFVGNIADDPGQRDIVEAIIALTERLNVHAIAEGVETHAQLAQLRRMGCRLAQGYLLSTPIQSTEAEELISQITRGTGLLPALET